ncbi:hypothetical protein H4684_003305 [Desulfomicrobium macestii]|uniref:Uncharacterized protein n=1 Tax=Desulfomicrobium macestii TaxID=90731 RepID=A0ABR9H7F5_9BACT|nr:hypothetical protein [Desulfomicrobium macestii]MBE1426639.1 hypothetical protein [Desulfomicrobium macestii]
MQIDGKELSRKARRKARREGIRQCGRKMVTVVMKDDTKQTGRKVKHKKNWMMGNCHDTES